jgi:hypothetical protein
MIMWGNPWFYLHVLWLFHVFEILQLSHFNCPLDYTQILVNESSQVDNEIDHLELVVSWIGYRIFKKINYLLCIL